MPDQALDARLSWPFFLTYFETLCPFDATRRYTWPAARHPTVVIPVVDAVPFIHADGPGAGGGTSRREVGDEHWILSALIAGDPYGQLRAEFNLTLRGDAQAESRQNLALRAEFRCYRPFRLRRLGSLDHAGPAHGPRRAPDSVDMVLASTPIPSSLSVRSHLSRLVL